MLYNILKILLKASTRFFFRDITINNANRIPSKDPVLIVANHPNTFMDPILIAAFLDRKVYFLAKAVVFKSKFAKWLLPKFNMIPVYRAQDDPGLTHKNEETFERCFDHLENNGAIIMFPEGISLTERKLRKIKTGAARISLGAESRNNFSLGVKIIPVGLHYSDPHSFRSKVLLNVHEPISVSDFADEYKKDEFKGVELLTEQIRKALEKHIIAFEDDFTDEMTRHVEIIYKSRIAKELNISLSDQQQNFDLTKAIMASVKHFYETDPKRVYDLKTKTDYYLNNLERTGLKDRLLDNVKKNDTFFLSNFKTLLFILLGAPVFLYGIMNNLIPFRIPFLINRKFVPKTEFRAAIGMVSGTFVFLIFYSFQSFLFYRFISSSWYLLLYIASMPASGLFAYLYYLVLKKLRNRWFLLSIFYKKTALVSRLVQLREEIIKELDKARRDYDNREEKVEGLKSSPL